MGRKSNIDFIWNKSHLDIIDAKGFGPDFNKAIADELLSRADKYTPFSLHDYGGRFHMANMVYTRGTKDKGLVVYTVPYAKVQYTKKFNHTLAVHPLATDHWFEAMWKAEKRPALKKINNMRKRFAK